MRIPHIEIRSAPSNALRLGSRHFRDRILQRGSVRLRKRRLASFATEVGFSGRD